MIKKIRNNAFAWNSLVLFSGTMVVNVLNYIFHLVIGRMVSISTYGEIESLLSLMSIISIPAGMLVMIATRYSAYFKSENDKKSGYALFKYLNHKVFKYGTPFFILLLALTPLARNFLKIENNLSLVLIWSAMFLSLFGSSATGILNGWQKFGRSNFAGILGVAFKLIFGFVFVKIGYQLDGAIGSFTVAVIITYAFSLFFIHYLLKQPKKETNVEKLIENKINFDEIRKYVWPAFLGNMSIVIMSNADMVLAKHNLGEEMAGQYGALSIVSKIIFFATGVIATVLFSMSAEDNYKKNNTQKIFWRAFWIIFFFSFFATVFYFLFPAFTLSFVFGSKYRSASNYLGWFALSVGLFSLVNLTIQYFLSIHKAKPVYGFLAISVLALFSILFFGKNIYDIIGIMIAFQFISVLAGFYFLKYEK